MAFSVPLMVRCEADLSKPSLEPRTYADPIWRAIDRQVRPPKWSASNNDSEGTGGGALKEQLAHTL